MCGVRTGAGNVIGAVKLLEADTSLMQRTGADRVRMLAKSDWGHGILLREGAPAKLLALLHEGADQSGHLSSPHPLQVEIVEHGADVLHSKSSLCGIVLKAIYVLFNYCPFVAGVITAALKALDALCAQYDGREALVLAGGYIADVTTSSYHYSFSEAVMRAPVVS